MNGFSQGFGADLGRSAFGLSVVDDSWRPSANPRLEDDPRPRRGRTNASASVSSSSSINRPYCACSSPKGDSSTSLSRCPFGTSTSTVLRPDHSTVSTFCSWARAWCQSWYLSRLSMLAPGDQERASDRPSSTYHPTSYRSPDHQNSPLPGPVTRASSSSS